MLTIQYYNKMEIRMGSPYSVCKIRLSGDWIPDIPEDDWQDLKTYDSSKKRLALVRWDTPENQPGFRLYIIDSVKHCVEISERFSGCCTKIEWIAPNTIRWAAFPQLNGTYKLDREE